jgi:DNA-binding SARP family transcriptional activator
MDKAAWRIELFGGLAILKDGVPTAHKVASRAATTDLLALLVLNKGRWADADTLATRLWPESQSWHTADNLHAATSRLRAALGDSGKDIFVRQGQLYRIDAEKVTTDVTDFDNLARKITFADGIDDDIRAALGEIEELYKGDLLGRGEPCRNQTLLAYNQQYKTKMLSVWESAAGLYLECGDTTSRIRARWYAENIKRLQGPEVARTRRTREPMLGQLREGERLDALVGTIKEERDTNHRPSIRSQLAEGKRQIAQQHSAVPQKAAAKSHGMEV